MKTDLTKRKSAKAPFFNQTFAGFRGVSVKLILVLTFILITLPLFTTFNDLLTKIVEKVGVYTYLSQNVVPFETRAVSLILRPLKIPSRPTPTFLYVGSPGNETPVFFSWNCLGWQSAVLLILTLAVGLSGKYTLISKIETVLFGIAGTFLMNLVRITIVILIAFYYGQLPSRVFHDYGGILLTIIWFFFYWWFAYTFLLEKEGLV